MYIAKVVYVEEMPGERLKRESATNTVFLVKT